MNKATAIQQWMYGQSTNAPGLERKLTALEREKTRLVDAYQAEVIELAELAE